MDVTTLIIWLAIGAVAGWLAGILLKGGGFGLIGNIIVGIIGSFIGGWLTNMFGISIGGGALVSSIITAVIGAVVLLFIIGLIKRA